MKLNLSNNKKTANRGITLIALVITIIVLLILAGVSIAMLTGENGILTQASTSKERTERAEAIERAKLDIMAWRAEELSNGRQATVTDAQIQTILTGKEYVASLDETSFTTKEGHTILYSELYTETEQVGEEETEVDGVTIPAGFYHVEGTTKAGGLVISDKPNDDLNNTAGGNQFVWIPVEDIDDFITVEGYYDGDLDSMLSNCSEPYASGYETEPNEYNLMKQSVQDNDGFYIGRFEAGIEGGTFDEENEIWEGGKVVVKKNAQVYNCIGWNASGDMDDETGGAVELAKNFDTANRYTSVTSTLCYGVQWDAALNFIDPNYITNRDEEGNPTCSENSYVRNSTGKGNYYEDANANPWKGGPTETGKSPDYSIKNIYDMAGNVYEWTMEAFDTVGRVNRGGYYRGGSSSPASGRGGNIPSDSGDGLGFRLALYLLNWNCERIRNQKL